MRTSVFICSFILSVIGFAQFNIDSVENTLDQRKVDTTLINDHLLIAEHYLKSDSAKCYSHIKSAEQIAARLKEDEKKGEAYVMMGKYYLTWEYDLEKAGNYYHQALELFRQSHAIDKEIQITERLGFLYSRQGNPEKSFDLFEEGLLLHPENATYKCVINNTIGLIMKELQEYDKALPYFNESEKQYQSIENPSKLLVQTQISNDKDRGVIYRNLERYDTAQMYLNRSLQKAIEVNDSTWISFNYNSIAIMYHRQNLFLQAIEMYEKSLAIKRDMGYTDGIVTTLTNLGQIHNEMGNYKKALLYLKEADGLCGPGCRLGRQANVLNTISEVYYNTQDYKIAYEKLRRYTVLQDSIDRIQNTELSKELEAKYQNNMHAIEEEKLKAELTAAELREESRNNEFQRQRTMQILGISFTVVLLILMIIIIRSNLKRNAANKQLTSKNEEIIAKSEEIENQKHQIQEQNQEIRDSINYAKRIQEAILPNPEFIQKHLPQSFVFYQPKEVLAGDFYWVDIIDDMVIWAAADCTGHGIPGAMVSVVCHNALNRSIHELGLKEPGQILTSTRELVIDTFRKSGKEVKDGMDIAMCCLNKPTREFTFAGANNPLWLIRETKGEEVGEKDFISEDGKFYLKEFKGDKQPVGLHYSNEPFNTIKIDILKNDQLFVFTDGFADQFGGEKGKKLKYKNFKKMLLSYAHLTIDEQLEKINLSFNKWKGDFEQLDDVCIIGIKI